MKARKVRVLDQDLWVAVKPGAKDRPPLLLFNGVGANVELAEPFMRAMGDVETIIFDIPGVEKFSLAAETAVHVVRRANVEPGISRVVRGGPAFLHVEQEVHDFIAHLERALADLTG